MNVEVGIPTAWPSFHVRCFQNRLYKGYWLNIYLSWLHHQKNMNSLLKSCDTSNHNLYLVIHSGPTLSELSWHVIKYNLIWSLPRYQSSWSRHGAHLGPVGSRWASCWPHEPCYQGIYPQEQRDLFLQNTDYESINPFVMSPKLHKMLVEVSAVYIFGNTQQWVSIMSTWLMIKALSLTTNLKCCHTNMNTSFMMFLSCHNNFFHVSSLAPKIDPDL